MLALKVVSVLINIVMLINNSRLPDADCRAVGPCFLKYDKSLGRMVTAEGKAKDGLESGWSQSPLS